jgi:hypothetical protein
VGTGERNGNAKRVTLSSFHAVGIGTISRGQLGAGDGLRGSGMNNTSRVSGDAVRIISIWGSQGATIGDSPLLVWEIVHTDSSIAEVVVVATQVSHDSSSCHVASSSGVIDRHSVRRVTFQMNSRSIDHLTLIVWKLLDG